MASPPKLSLPVDPQNFVIKGDLDVLTSLNTNDMGFGTVFIRDGGLYVEGLTDLNNTTITTTASPGGFNVEGAGEILFNVAAPINFTTTASNPINLTSSGEILLSSNEQMKLDSTASSILMTAGGPSSFITSVGSLTLQTTGSAAGDNVVISSAAVKPDSVFITATDTTSGQVTIVSESTSTTDPAIILRASGATGGNVSISTTGTNSEILLSSADSVTIEGNGASSKVSITSLNNANTAEAILLDASEPVGGSILLSAGGAGTAFVSSTNLTPQSIQLLSNSTDPDARISLLSRGTAIDNAIDLTALTGGININAGNNVTIFGGLGVSIDASDASTIDIGTNSDSNVTIGNASTITTIAGDLNIQGTTTTINTATLNVTDNIITINSGNGELGLDSGIIIRRYQTPNGTPEGDVVDDTANLPEIVPKTIEEQGTCRVSGLVTSPSTQIQLDEYASSAINAYVGWWIKITSGAAGVINQVRRIKAYDEVNKVATIYGTSDAGPPPPDPLHNPDALDWANPLTGVETYRLYSASYIATFYDESLDKWSITTTAVTPSAISGDTDLTTAVVAIQQYQDCAMGAVDIVPKYYRNTHGAAITSPDDGLISFTIINHGMVDEDMVKISDPVLFDPPLAPGIYKITKVDNDTFTIKNTDTATAAVDVPAASATINIMNSSVLRVNKIIPYDTGASGISIPGVSATMDVTIDNTSTDTGDLIDITDTSGSYLILVSDLDPSGASAMFSASSSGSGGSVSRISSAMGANGQRLDANWLLGNVVQIKHSSLGTIGTLPPTGTYTYRVRVISAI